MFSKQCKAHLDEVGLGPIAHMLRAWKIAFTFLLLFPVMIIHGLAPRFFTTTATNYMRKLLDAKDEELEQNANK